MAGSYEIIADELLGGTDTGKTESKTAQAEALILDLLTNGKKCQFQSWKRRLMTWRYRPEHSEQQNPDRRPICHREKRHFEDLIFPGMNREGKDSKMIMDTLKLPTYLLLFLTTIFYRRISYDIDHKHSKKQRSPSFQKN